MKPNTNKRPLDYDVMVVGAGVAGMETAASLGDMGYRVLLVDKNASIGGRAILLSKVFPTLDCASCIVTPKMASVSHHPNVQLMTYSEVDGIQRNEDGSFAVEMHRKASYVDFDACTGCGMCEEVCTVAVPDQYNYDLVTRRVAHIPFPQAVPKKAVINWRGEAPCTIGCPGDVNASGYISLVRAGRYKEAFNLHLENAPLVGSLSRACNAPCESACTRSKKEGTLHIRGIKRFMVDHYYAEHPEPEYGPVEKQLDTRVAVVGSGPAGLSAAFYLARQGHQVTIFEAEAEAGGMLRTVIPSYRLPKDVVDRDIKNVTALGVEIKTGHKVTSLPDLKQQGFNAILMAAGASEENNMDIEGQDLDGITGGMQFLREVNIGEMPDVKDKNVMVIGGSNTAIDAARAAIRMGAAKVIINYQRGRKKMPAHPREIDGAEEEGVELMLMSAPKRFVGKDGKLVAVECQSVGKGDVPIEGSEEVIPIDMAILSTGLSPSVAHFPAEIKNSEGLLSTNRQTFQTSDPDVFACGDCVKPHTMIINIIAQGRRAAFSIDRYLKGEALDAPSQSAQQKADKKVVLEEAEHFVERQPVPQPVLPLDVRQKTFECYEKAMTEAEARQEAQRCMDCGECSQCMECVSVCAPNCIDFTQKPTPMSLNVGTVVVSTGFKILDPAINELLGYGKLPDVVSGPQMDRLVAPTRPYNSVLRPSDGKEPENIAIVLCNGSRDQTVCNPLCCRIGCMYSIKLAQLTMGALPLADITIYTIDVRAFGKGYDEFYEQSKAMGIEFVKGKIARVEQLPNGNMALHFEDQLGEGGRKIREHDLVVLTVGFLPNTDPFSLYKGGEPLAANDLGYVGEIDPISEPACTNINGLFVAGTAIGAMDIPDTVLHSGAAAAQAAAYLEQMRGK
ncbi:MAG: FAD-dependent oxidoreductase [Alphaproteobacteria bacterium]